MAVKIWVLWTELEDDAPVSAEYFTDRDDARRHGIELAGGRRGSELEWGPPRHEPGLPRYNRDDISVGDPSLWPDFEVLWERKADGSVSGYFKLDAVLLNSSLTECDLQRDHGFSPEEASEARKN